MADINQPLDPNSQNSDQPQSSQDKYGKGIRGINNRLVSTLSHVVGEEVSRRTLKCVVPTLLFSMFVQAVSFAFIVIGFGVLGGIMVIVGKFITMLTSFCLVNCKR